MEKEFKISRRVFVKTTGFAAVCIAAGSPMSVIPAMAEEEDFIKKRQASVYKTDAAVYKTRKSQDNPMVKKIYDHKEGFLHDGPCGHMSHHLLHTHYTDRSAKIKELKSKGFKFAI